MNTKKGILVIGNAITLVITIFINYLSNTGAFNGNTMKTVSDRYHNLFTPASYAFSIWVLIYLLLIAFVIYTFAVLRRDAENRLILRVGGWFMITCLANCLWVVAWLYDYTGISVLLMVILLFALTRIIIRTKMEIINPPFRVVAFLWWPFSLYAGWISVALIANIAAYLTRVGWRGFGLSQISWTIIMIIVAGVLYLFMTWKRNMREYALVGCWALIAVAVANKEAVHLIYIIAWIVAIIIAVSTLLHAIKNFRGFGHSLEHYE